MSKFAWVVLIYAVLAFAAYHMPWHSHPAAAFANNAFDLAEGASLHPQTHLESPMLLTSLLLRIPIIFLAGIVVLSAQQLHSAPAQWIWQGIAILMILRLNPPEIFYPFGGGSPNDQQLGYLMFAGLGIIFGLMVIGRWTIRFYRLVVVALIATMALLSSLGFQRADDIFRNYLRLEVTLGGGFILFMSLSLLMIVYSLINILTE